MTTASPPEADGRVSGRCACGAVAFSVDGIEPVGLNCYCEICRVIAGAPFSSVVRARRGSFRIERGEDALSRYESSPGFHRVHCRVCHAPIIGEGDAPDVPLFVSATALPATAIRDVVFDHMFVRSLVPWHRILDDRPRFETFWDAE